MNSQPHRASGDSRQLNKFSSRGGYHGMLKHHGRPLETQTMTKSSVAIISTLHCSTGPTNPETSVDRPMRTIWIVLISALFQFSCGGNHHFRETTPAETASVPPYLELHSRYRVGTLHLPQGTYVLNAVDDKGYYYRSTHRINQRSYSGSIGRDGGIFVEKRNRKRLRAYTRK